MKIELKYPITKESNGKEYKISEIELQRIKMKHLKKLPKGFFDELNSGALEPYKLVPLISALTNLSKDEIDCMDLTDLLQISGRLNEMLGELSARTE